ncbi:MAG: DUF1707 domain-containing protein [Propionibacteriales bacterium]|nr:DUF1707 domain-containing protein [Propionibacteriales bacterium]
MIRRRSPAPTDRAGDADRERTADLLADAHAAGYLTTEELDPRLETALAARTHGELGPLIADLPSSWRAERSRRRVADDRRQEARASLVSHIGSYLRLMALLVAIWLVLGVTVDAWYPWPVWPALGFGIGLAAHVRRAYGDTARTPA